MKNINIHLFHIVCIIQLVINCMKAHLSRNQDLILKFTRIRFKALNFAEKYSKTTKTADHQLGKAPRSPPPKAHEVKKVDYGQEIAPVSDNNSQDEAYCEPLGLISDNRKHNAFPSVLAVPSDNLDNRLSSPYLKPLPASPEENKANVYDYVTRDEIQKGIPKYPKHYPDRKIFKVTAKKEHVEIYENYTDTNEYDSNDPHLYATLDHGDG